MKGPLVVEGDLWLVSQEGGYADESWEIDGNELSQMVIDHFQATAKRWKDYPKDTHPLERRAGDTPLGRVRITIEQLEAPA
jgi:hypothetical protein